jgi:hypothetical protein
MRDLEIGVDRSEAGAYFFYRKLNDRWYEVDEAVSWNDDAQQANRVRSCTSMTNSWPKPWIRRSGRAVTVWSRIAPLRNSTTSPRADLKARCSAVVRSTVDSRTEITELSLLTIQR